ncbi:MAG: DUF4345 domain-containing protein [Bacteroidota bacterium]
MIKSLHLAISAIIIAGVALIYGFNPSKILPLLFEFKAENLELKNIFRAMMGMYLGFAIYWSIGVLKSDHWKSATISNVIFMGGLAFGRLVSTIFDGISNQFIIGLILELLLMFWGIYNLRKYEAIK